MIRRIDVRVVAPVHDTELTDRVVDAVHEPFPDADITRDPGRVVGETHTLDGFAEQLREREILDTARRQFDRDEDGFSFALKKQAAYEGVVTFAVGEPDELGELSVDVSVAEPSVEAVIDRVAPPTVDGEPIE